MASILDRYGIKEVADVTFYKIGSDGKPSTPVLFLDTLKVSTIEQTAETADARGGKGNPKLITWDYGKEINVTIEDALYSPKSMALMLGNGTVAQGSGAWIQKTAVIRLASTLVSSKIKAAVEYITTDIYDSDEGSKRIKLSFPGSGTAPAGTVAFTNQIAFTYGDITSKLYDEDGKVLDTAFTSSELSTLINTGVESWTVGDDTILASSVLGHKLMFTYWVKATKKEIVVSGDSFPGTYYITGDTYCRSDIDGKDQFFQFIIPKAKMTAEQTITLQAEGDPTTFNMNLTVLRPEDGDMMKLVQYDLEAPAVG